ncbi:DUF2076 domain-containing protein [Ancylobacter sp. TS-1]|uniref:DUF2076 domain-containing protein n=1 Tax=Ancylobacter sp. TS-1 TaxID=1850374 RepID=UPI001265CB24|nr:DUF2076 domain-containing protein [Ancylobacter sp. TS-1]QFR34082.1 DUF2076 family protein [Ancylobacter sp. TS-1]
MNDQDRQAIDGLFAKLAEAERLSGPRDPQAEGFIAERIAGQPAAPYLMAQTIVMQDYALQQAQARIEELERQAEEARQAQEQEARPAGGGGLFGGLFGSGQPPARRSPVPSMPRAAGGAPANAIPADASPAWRTGAPVAGAPQAGPFGNQPGMQPGQPGGFGRPGFGGGGGGFLAGAAQTAMGVAGGVLLGSAIAGMFGGSEAKAAEAPAEPAADASAQDASAQDSGAADQDLGAQDIGAADDGGFFGGGWFDSGDEI